VTPKLGPVRRAVTPAAPANGLAGLYFSDPEVAYWNLELNHLGCPPVALFKLHHSSDIHVTKHLSIYLKLHAPNWINLFPTFQHGIGKLSYSCNRTCFLFVLWTFFRTNIMTSSSSLLCAQTFDVSSCPTEMGCMPAVCSNTCDLWLYISLILDYGPRFA
jgi:hypothetical protein